MTTETQKSWPVLKTYDQDHLGRIALPLGGIGTGTVSLGGRGDLRDWEIMNKPAKGFVPRPAPFFVLYAKPTGNDAVTRLLEGPVPLYEYEGASGCAVPNHGLPRFRTCSFAAAYPLGQVMLSDPDVAVNVCLQAFNPLIPADADSSGIPVAVLRFVLANRTARSVTTSVCGSIPNIVGHTQDAGPQEARQRRNVVRKGKHVQGVFMLSDDTAARSESWGTLALATTARTGVALRVANPPAAALAFWDTFSRSGKPDRRLDLSSGWPMGSVTVTTRIPAKGTKDIMFLLTWHFPNRRSWTSVDGDGWGVGGEVIGNHYTTQYEDAWDVARKVAPRLRKLESKTLDFVNAFCASDLPKEAKEAALFNISTLRTQTCFRTPDARFFGWEGCCDGRGCCYGSCTHVWNYEQATAFLFGDLAMSMRETEFAHATDDNGFMSFRVNLPIECAQVSRKAAADGQMGCIMKMYRDWQLSGDDDKLRALWPGVRKAVEFCWTEGGWDADQDGVMEGCQHNTMDVEYYGPNPQMGFWYLGALRAAQTMAAYLGEDDFARLCGELFEKGSQWIDKHLFNGEYYEHLVRPPEHASDIAGGLRFASLGRDSDLREPAYQLGAGCLVDQLVGQYMAHVCGLGYLADRKNIRKTLQSILKYNSRGSFHSHFNDGRSFALGDEAALLMASYPRGRRPERPFPFWTEVMTGFEYAAAVHLLYEGRIRQGLRCIRNVRDRYDGHKRSPFDEAECGHHYARAMASWAVVLALTGFQYSGVEQSMRFNVTSGMYFWSNGYAWGSCRVHPQPRGWTVRIHVMHGRLKLKTFTLEGKGEAHFARPTTIRADEAKTFPIRAMRSSPDRFNLRGSAA